MGCPSKHYGENCNLCNPKCRDTVCDAFNGSCIYGCRDNVIESPYCSECKDGYYGPDCTQNCSYCKTGTLCNKTSGICPNGCQDKWGDPRCT
ncbi:cell death abnormality protein 1-like, partial [Saccostrea cucullata]|uniref:cell death abnormality protein 1-like n=1 Tax=Saccostrea cuccullata TaxID=36930 RepID=UPI002ED00775